MRTLNTKATKVLEALTKGLLEGTSRKVDNTNGAWMPVSVEHLYGTHYRTAHYFEQNGDLVPDPDVEFLKTPEGWVPLAIQQCTGHYSRPIRLSDDGTTITGIAPRAYADLVSFCNMWMSNVAAQQGGLKALKA